MHRNRMIGAYVSEKQLDQRSWAWGWLRVPDWSGVGTTKFLGPMLTLVDQLQPR